MASAICDRQQFPVHRNSTWYAGVTVRILAEPLSYAIGGGKATDVRCHGGAGTPLRRSEGGRVVCGVPVRVPMHFGDGAGPLIRARFGPTLGTVGFRRRRVSANCPWRVGIGYDIHRLADGVRLKLGGVEIDHPRGLAGHSDGDAVLHAIADAFLGA
ncbi:MAG: 2-C-methyl-D-erythritol 2,4-cyclodiphosphate synthase, partial [Phycisphaerales bacterium]